MSGISFYNLPTGFVDFNARTSNLTDSRFVEHLELLYRHFNNLNEPPRFTRETVNSLGFYQEIAEKSVFHLNRYGLENFDIFFVADPPIFKHHIPVVDDRGRLILNNEYHNRMWASISIVVGENSDLAWEFVQYMIYAYTNPVGTARLDPVSWAPMWWGNNSISTPILRSSFRDRLRNILEYVYDNHYHPILGDATAPSGRMQAFVSFDDPVNRNQQFDNAINRIAAYNEQPMGMLFSMIPARLFEDHLDQFFAGLIDAQTTAHRIHNAVTLWLIE